MPELNSVKCANCCKKELFNKEIFDLNRDYDKKAFCNRTCYSSYAIRCFENSIKFNKNNCIIRT